jgi:hypothetical protein
LVSMKTINVQFDIPTTVWEVIPYSFIVDRFVNIGQVLQAWYVKRSVSRSLFSLGTKGTYVYTQRRVPVNGTCTGNTVSGDAHETKETLVWLNRIPCSGPNYIPSVDVHLDASVILDIADLLTKRIPIPQK